MNLHDELFELLETVEAWLDAHAPYCDDCKYCTATEIETLIEIISHYPPPTEPKWWCKCGWVGSSGQLERIGMLHPGAVIVVCPGCRKSRDLTLCGKMPWQEGND